MIALGSIVMTLAFVHVAAVAALAVWPTARAWVVVAVLLVGAAAGLVAVEGLLPGRGLAAPASAAASAIAACVVYAVRRQALHAAGAAVWVSWLAFGVCSGVWSVMFLASQELSSMTRALLWSGIALAAITLPSAVVTTREGWEALLRREWSRPHQPPAAPPRRLPRVSIHVPAHAEPPAVVMSTLDRIAALDYPDFEVLVIDNNTDDEALWLPVQQHCERLGRRFRFLRVQGLSGAKAGALNWALPQTAPDAELVAVVDADYHVEPDWLRSTVGFFEDPRLGFVQAPHAYRDYQHSRFGRWANAEYSVFFQAGMVALDEHNAGLTVGTMSLIRRQALLDAGGWAEWCLTEDSELAIRIHAAGYSSTYLTHPYGRGLIPETFASYRQQRFRWTYGPIQEIQHHWRLFVPRHLGGQRSALTGRQKLHHANHGIDVMCIGLRLLALMVGALTGVSMLLHDERVLVPVELWSATTALLIGSLIIRYLVYMRVVGATLTAALGGVVAFAGLSLAIATASIRSTVRAPAAWRRTTKFRPTRRGAGALKQARSEALLALGGLTGAAVLAVASAGGIVTMLAIGLAMQATTYLAAPLLALSADRALHLPDRTAYSPYTQTELAA